MEKSSKKLRGANDANNPVPEVAHTISNTTTTSVTTGAPNTMEPLSGHAVETLSNHSLDSHFLCFEGLTVNWNDCCDWFYGITVSSHFIWINRMYWTVIGEKQLLWLDMGSNDDACKLRGYVTHQTMPDNSLIISHFISESTFQSAVQVHTDEWICPAPIPMEGSSQPPLEECLTSPKHIAESSKSPLRDVSLLQQAGVTLEERVEGVQPRCHE